MFKMIGMGDLHFPCRDKRNLLLNEETRAIRDEFYTYFFQQLFKNDADLYFSVGDMTTSGDMVEFENIYKIIRNHQKKFQQVLGNHDLLQHTRGTLFSSLKMDYNMLIEDDDLFIVFLETGREMDHANFGGWVTKEQKDWVRKIIALSKTKTLVIIAHHPVYNTTRNSSKDMHHVDPKTELWSVLQEKKDGKAFYINGHIHEDSIATRDNWHFIQFCAVLDDPAIRMFEITKERFSYHTRILTDDRMRQKARLVGEMNEQCKSQEDDPGTESERNLEVVLSGEFLVRDPEVVY